MTSSHIREAVITWTAIVFPLFALCTLIGFLSTMYTLFELYDAKVYLLLVGLPAVCGAWLTILIRNLLKAVATFWLAMPMVVAALVGGLALVAGHNYPG